MRPSGILGYDGDEFPNRHAQPITDEYRDWPFTWFEKLDTYGFPWLDAPDGQWAGGANGGLNRHRGGGGGCLMFELPPGWYGQPLAPRGAVEEFVLEGSVEVAGERYGEWGYACRAVGEQAGEYRSPEGARLICWWDAGELS